jgi:hypothetical protein
MECHGIQKIADFEGTNYFGFVVGNFVGAGFEAR